MEEVERRGGTDLEERADPRTAEPGDHDLFAHYALKEAITRAYINGTPVRALCGKVWVPSRDPERFPICPECKRLYDLGPEGREAEWARRSAEGSGGA